MAVLLDTSSSHSSSTAIHTAEAKGNRNRHTEQPMAPASRKGRLRPHFGTHVLSEMAPIMGWISRPVIGPARFSSGISSGSAPRNW